MNLLVQWASKVCPFSHINNKFREIYSLILILILISIPNLFLSGMAWTSMGGEIMFVEATKMDGDGELTLTGQLGDVMKESAQLALNWVRTHAAKVWNKPLKGTG